jgi:hypothetical protein
MVSLIHFPRILCIPWSPFLNLGSRMERWWGAVHLWTGSLSSAVNASERSEENAGARDRRGRPFVDGEGFAEWNGLIP